MFGGCRLQDVWWVSSSRFLVGVFKICGGCLQDFWAPPLNPPSAPGPPPPLALRRTTQNFALFCFSLPPEISFFLLSLGVLLVEFWRFLKAGTLKCAHLGSRRPRSRRGFTRQPENSKRAHLRAPALQTPPKFHEKTPREKEERMKFPEGERKKRAKFWAPHPSGPQPFGPQLGHPVGWRLKRGETALQPRKCSPQHVEANCSSLPTTTLRHDANLHDAHVKNLTSTTCSKQWLKNTCLHRIFSDFIDVQSQPGVAEPTKPMCPSTFFLRVPSNSCSVQ